MKQTGLRPSWPRGKGIAETFGFLAQAGFLVTFGSFIIGHIFPDLDPGEPRLSDLVSGSGMAALFGWVWLALRRDSLVLALLGVGIIGAALAGLILYVAVQNMMLSQSIGGFDGLILYGVGSLALFGCGWAFQEIRREIARRAADA